jgi:hypothetical protein
VGTANEREEYNTLRVLRTGMKTFMDAQRPIGPPVKVAVRTVPYTQKFKRLENFFFNVSSINPLNAELNPICHLLVLLVAHLILRVRRIRVKFYENPSSGSRVVI